MTWLSWLTQHIIFQTMKGNNELTDYQLCCLLFACFFLFNQSKNNAVLEPSTGHILELVGFETKDLSFEAKDFKMCL